MSDYITLDEVLHHQQVAEQRQLQIQMRKAYEEAKATGGVAMLFGKCACVLSKQEYHERECQGRTIIKEVNGHFATFLVT